ncbi:hypothetical protein JOF56_010842 [Kibdelosporangium banguiense]|uniref:DUF1152 domain-containing protein n=1 Tax=Kibdelosporangium banguiense TaxID=1365924 RepID=A0ABS4U1D2_9PSEU|nr:DUF1152 domain-containing protein [Kibdelosporangium banguiense]MBP2330457.1 hypothetical protein [Kibdelosporangium banguiense]
MTSTLYVAAGGGGDAIAAAVLANRNAPGERAAIATYAWDRLIIDPLPGPRGAQDFNNLNEHAAHVWEITPNTTLKPPAGSTLPRLARELDARLFLLDPYSGAIGMAEQLQSIARFLGASSLVLVDVGGDLVARGDEPELRSPLADALALAACALTRLPCEVLIAGPGTDGELSEEQVAGRCRALHCTRYPDLRPDQVEHILPIFEWHPSEATGLWVSAVAGKRGTAEIRDAGLQVILNDTTGQVYATPMERVTQAHLFVGELTGTRSLSDVEEVVRHAQGRTEIDYERTKASGMHASSGELSEPAVIGRVSRVSSDARERADYLTVRRLAELIKFPVRDFSQLTRILRSINPARITPPLWMTRSHLDG